MDLCQAVLQLDLEIHTGGELKALQGLNGLVDAAKDEPSVEDAELVVEEVGGGLLAVKLLKPLNINATGDVPRLGFGALVEKDEVVGAKGSKDVGHVVDVTDVRPDDAVEFGDVLLEPLVDGGEAGVRRVPVFHLEDAVHLHVERAEEVKQLARWFVKPEEKNTSVWERATEEVHGKARLTEKLGTELVPKLPHGKDDGVAVGVGRVLEECATGSFVVEVREVENVCERFIWDWKRNVFSCLLNRDDWNDSGKAVGVDKKKTGY